MTGKKEQRKMKAVSIDRFGGVKELKLSTVPIPKVAADEILIRVHTAGIGVWDAKEREGIFAKMRGEENPDFPKILGKDASGTIIDAGENVDDLKEGDQVYINGSPDANANLYTQYATSKAKHAILIPENLSVEEAGAMPVAAITALTGLDNILQLKKDESVLIFGASGGLGHIAVQLAKRMGAKVFAISSGNDGVKLAKKAGADAAINGREENIIEAAREFTPNGMDAALLTTGGIAARNSIKAVRDGGRVAYPNGADPEADEHPDIDIQAFNMKSSMEVYKKLNSLIQSGPFFVHIDQTFKLEEAKNAHRKLDEHYLGKLAFKIDQ